MKVVFSVVGSIDPFRPVIAEMDAVPREGETVELPGLPAELTQVRTVVWYPAGEGDDQGPFVYIVLGKRRPS